MPKRCARPQISPYPATPLAAWRPRATAFAAQGEEKTCFRGAAHKAHLFGALHTLLEVAHGLALTAEQLRQRAEQLGHRPFTQKRGMRREVLRIGREQCGQRLCIL